MNILTIILAVIVFGILIFVHELGHFVAAKRSGVRVNEFAVGMGPILFSFDRGETKYSLRLVPMGGFCAMEGEDGEEGDNPRVRPDSTTKAFQEVSIVRRVIIMVAGAAMNLLLGLIILGYLTTQQPLLGTTQIAYFHDNATSSQMLEPGDTILRVNGHRVRTSNDLSYELMRSRTGELDMVVVREGETLHLNRVPFEMTRYEDGTSFIHVDYVLIGVDKTVTGVIGNAFNWTGSIVKQVWGSLIDLLTGRYTINQLSGPVGVTSAIGQASTMGLDSLLLMVAFITINLGVFNLLPLPALDGGRLLFLLLELIRRKPINPRYEGIVHTVGFMLLVGLLLFVTFNDVAGLIGGSSVG